MNNIVAFSNWSIGFVRVKESAKVAGGWDIRFAKELWRHRIAFLICNGILKKTQSARFGCYFVHIPQLHLQITQSGAIVSESGPRSTCISVFVFVVFVFITVSPLFHLHCWRKSKWRQMHNVTNMHAHIPTYILIRLASRLLRQHRSVVDILRFSPIIGNNST